MTTKKFKEFTMKVERNWFTSKTYIQLDDGERVYRGILKVGEEKEVINNMIWTIGNDATYEEAKEYFVNHPEKL